MVVDDSQECDRAIYYASRRVSRIGVGMIMLRVIDIEDRNQQWLGVADIMRAEAYEEANAALDRAAGRRQWHCRHHAGTGDPRGCLDRAILKLIDEDEDIAILILAAGTASEGPGPLVSAIGRTAGEFPIPVAIVPGHLTDEELDALS